MKYTKLKKNPHTSLLITQSNLAEMMTYRKEKTSISKRFFINIIKNIKYKSNHIIRIRDLKKKKRKKKL